MQELQEKSEASPVRCLDPEAEKQMMEAIDKAKADGDSIGGVVQTVVEGLPVGLGSHVQYDHKLDGKIVGAVASINAFKGAEVGIGFEAANRPGSQVHDEIVWDEENGYYRSTNNLGGFEGGMTNGMPVVIQGVMKPIPTLYKPLQSVDIDSKEPFKASIERSDSCAVPAASVVMENVVAFEVAVSFLDMFGTDNVDRIRRNFEEYVQEAKDF
jgi:chorismate synthase